MLKQAYRRLRWSYFWRTCQLDELDLNSLISTTPHRVPLITEKLCLPPYEGPVTHDDISPLLALVDRFQPKVVLELGTAHGTTVANICANCQARVFTVNALPEQISGQLTTFALSKDEIGYVYRKHGFADRVVQIYENTRTFRPTDYMSPSSIDFAIIDACHDADFVVSDFRCILPVLGKNAIVLFHDVHPSMELHLGDSYIACMYLRKLGFDIQHLSGTWWGIWRGRKTTAAGNWLEQAGNLLDNLIRKARGIDPEDDALSLKWFTSLYGPRAKTGHDSK